LATLRTSPSATVWVSACVSSCVRRRSDRLTIKPSRVAAVMMPKPPNWNSTRTTACPSPDQCVPVSTTVNPVTQTAETAVKSAVSQGVCTPGACDKGNINSAVPVAMSARKASATTREG
jgi:uncharacterized membrane protein